MANLDGDLWRYNIARVTLVDVSEDYQSFLGPMPSDFYPVLKEVISPKYKLMERLLNQEFVGGYCYDWHEAPDGDGEQHWYVGVVNENLI